jgi:hypothetical protein
MSFDTKDYQLCHFLTTPIHDKEWIYLAYGHDVSDSRCQGGAWYYQGNKELALAQLAEYKVEQAKRANDYYSQPWV